ncbi:MAG: hypothetical protein ABG776_03485 [Cyanobacteria bacterium J06555_13]
MAARRKVDHKIYRQFRQAYDSKFGSSAAQLAKAIDKAVPMEKAARRGKHVLSERAIHIFFNAEENPERQFNLTTLNYLSQGLLNVDNYNRAIEIAQVETEHTASPHQASDQVLDFPQEGRSLSELLNNHKQRNLDRYSQIKSYQMYEPLPITDIYIDLNVLEREQKRMLLRSSLANDSESAEPKRSEAGFLIVESGLSILDALDKYQRLMIWGRLGAGKTTTLRHILTSGKLEKHGIYLELRKVFNRSEGSILNYIFDEFKVTNEAEQKIIETHLIDGHFTIFLDGLDEVEADIFRNVCDQIESFVERYEGNNLIVTCRYGVYDYGFKRFTEVEACRLKLPQMEQYIQQWHKAKQNNAPTSAKELEIIEGLKKREKELIHALRTDEAIRRLASTPLILSLICITLESGRGIPHNMYALCESAFTTSIEKWDAHRNIQRALLKLSRLKKIDFLGEIGFDGMDRDIKKTAWKVHELVEKMEGILTTLPTYNKETLEEDSHKEIQALEGYHSLLKKAINDSYSFDTPIYQYFACANYIVRQEDPELVRRIIDTRLLDRQWKDIILMVAERRSNADKFLRQIFWKISHLAKSTTIQDILKWVYETAQASEVGYNSYRAGILAIDMEINFFLSRYSIDDETRRIAHTLARNLRELNRRYGKIIKSQDPFNIRLDLVCLNTLAEDYALTENISLKKPSDFASSYLSLLKDENFSFDRVLKEQSEVAERLGMKSLKAELLTLAKALPEEGKSDKREQWHTWSERLRAALNKHLNVGYSVSLSTEDEESLKDYLYATNLLAECFLVDASVTLETRTLLRHSLILPEEHIPKELLVPSL